jgi:uncharacterized protein YfiM (DUF2279 family)
MEGPFGLFNVLPLKQRVEQTVNRMAYMTGILFLFIFSLCSSLAQATDLTLFSPAETDSLENQRSTAVMTTLGGIGVVTGWGLLYWDYFSTKPNLADEGWFGNDTNSGGRDKLGHMYGSYLTTRGLSAFYRYRGMGDKESVLYGALSSFAIMAYMEFGDSMSDDHGFSTEDMIANSIGVLFGYWLESDDRVDRVLDYRWEYGFKPSSDDFTTDYENTKHLFALKLGGFERFRESPLRYLEIHVGYYTRGFDGGDAAKERFLYTGIGLNLSDLLIRNDWKKTGTVLRYLQLPYTYLPYAHDLN